MPVIERVQKTITNKKTLQNIKHNYAVIRKDALTRYNHVHVTYAHCLQGFDLLVKAAVDVVRVEERVS